MALLPCGYFQGEAKAMGVNPDRKSKVERLMWLDAIIDFLPAALAAKLIPNVSLSFSLDCISEAERGILMTTHPRISTCLTQVCALEKSLQCRWPTALETIQEAAVMSNRSRAIGISSDVMGCLWWWEGPSQSLWSATTSLKLDSPQQSRVPTSYM